MDNVHEVHVYNIIQAFKNDVDVDTPSQISPIVRQGVQKLRKHLSENVDPCELLSPEFVHDVVSHYSYE